LDFVNETFRNLLNEKDGQVKFVELQPRPDVLPGQVIRLSLGAGLLPAGEKPKEYQKARIEADVIANWIKDAGLKKLRSNSWRDVAILCPRKLWLRTIAAALRKVGLPVSIQSESDLKGDNPAYAWLTALCTIMADPRNSYEIVGVLREIFGITDQDLAIFSEAIGSRFRIDTESLGTGIVSSPLRLLAQIRRQMNGESLFNAVKHLVEQTQLREKLVSLPREDFTDLEGDLDTLLALAAEEETRETTLANFAQKLRLDFLLQRDVRRSSVDAIQLITAQKAKGSEWQAVILPFLGRNVRQPSPRYPAVIKIPGTTESLIALTNEDFPDEVRDADKIAAQQEMERLLYVAASRARHTLVLALDEEIFARSNGDIQKGAQLRCLLGENEINRPHFESLTVEATACADTNRDEEQASPNPDRVEDSLVRLDANAIKRGRLRAHNFVRKFNPSGYDHEADGEPMDRANEDSAPIPIVRSVSDTPATLYGRWWHALMQRIAWHDKQLWQAAFEEHQLSSSMPARSTAEWKLFLGFFEQESELSQMLARPDTVVRCEMPFLWLADKSRCLEGIVDLAIFDSKARQAFILDWKTNREDSPGFSDLRRRYLPQIAAYWQSISQLTGLRTTGAIYATSVGQLTIYRHDELAAEWERLRALPFDELTAQIERETVAAAIAEAAV
jgi:ATP-dependent exoDNAse (exonuclease V) beta subunit